MAFEFDDILNTVRVEYDVRALNAVIIDHDLATSLHVTTPPMVQVITQVNLGPSFPAPLRVKYFLQFEDLWVGPGSNRVKECLPLILDKAVRASSLNTVGHPLRKSQETW